MFCNGPSFEVEGLQRLLEASKTERDFLVRRYEVELDAAGAAAAADLRALRDAARGEIAARQGNGVLHRRGFQTNLPLFNAQLALP